MSGKNRNHFESPLSVWTNPVYKTSWASLPAKQAVTVGFSSGFNVKLLHDCSHGNFDLPKLMPVERIFLMPSSCLSLTLMYTPGYTPISYSLRLTQSGICGRQRPQKWMRWEFYCRCPFPSLPRPPPFFPIPNPFRRLLPQATHTTADTNPYILNVTQQCRCSFF